MSLKKLKDWKRANKNKIFYTKFLYINHYKNQNGPKELRQYKKKMLTEK